MGTEVASRDPAVKPGDVIEGRYRVIETLGVGSLGAVVLAEHVLIKRRVAIKVLRAELTEDPDLLDSFMNEARAAGTLGHPNIVECTDMGFTRTDEPYLVLEYLQGALLCDDVARHGAMPIRRALKVADRIASALAAAHKIGIAHRDLGSHNVFLAAKDEVIDLVKLLDFGTARLRESGGARTRRGPMAQTPDYLAPEQLTSPESVDHRADIYALGVLLYEMVTGRRPFADPDKRVIVQGILHRAPAPIERDELPPGLTALVVDKLLAKHPAHRPASIKEVQTELTALLDATGPVSANLVAPPVAPSAEPSGILSHPPAELIALPMVPRRRGRLGWLLGAVLAAALGAGLVYIEDSTASATAETASIALDLEAERLASALEAELRASQLRADGIAAAPMLRAAIETDAATLHDLLRSELAFEPRTGEVLEVFQHRAGAAAASMVRIPDNASSLAPVAEGHPRIASVGDTLILTVGAPVARQHGGTGGAVALAISLELTAAKARLARLTRAAELSGFGAPLHLVAGSAAKLSEPAPLVVELPLSAPLKPIDGKASLTVELAVAPSAVSSKLRVARIACWGLTGALLAVYLASLLHTRKRS